MMYNFYGSSHETMEKAFERLLHTYIDTLTDNEFTQLFNEICDFTHYEKIYDMDDMDILLYNKTPSEVLEITQWVDREDAVLRYDDFGELNSYSKGKASVSEVEQDDILNIILTDDNSYQAISDKNIKRIINLYRTFDY